MFNLFRKKQLAVIDHQYKNLVIPLPAHWQYELEEGDLEACFDPDSQSTLRLNIIKVMASAMLAAEQMTDDETIRSLTGDRAYTLTPKGYILTRPTIAAATESGRDITLFTWKLINATGNEKIMAVATYTLLSDERDSSHEKEMLYVIENSLRNAGLV